MSRREGRDSDSKRHRSKFDREPSPKRSRRDGKPATERPSSNLNLDVGDPLDRDQKHRQRLQDALPLESPPLPDSKKKTGAGRKEYEKRTNEPREGSKKFSNPTEVPRRKEYEKRTNEPREGSKKSSNPTEVPRRKEYEKRTNEPREGSKNSSNPTEVPRRKEYEKRINEPREGSKNSSNTTEVPRRKEYEKRTNEPRNGSKNSSNPAEVPRRKEFDKRTNGHHEGSKNSSNPTEVPQRKEFDKRIAEQPEESRNLSNPTEVPQRKEFDKRTAEQPEGSRNSSNPTEVPRSRFYFQHDEHGIARQGGRITGRGAATERGWRDSKDPHSERAVEKLSTRDTEQRDEKPQALKGGDERIWRHDGFYEIERDQPPPISKRPFREKKVSLVSENADKALSDPVKPSNSELPMLGRERREERGGRNTHYLERPEKLFVGDKAGSRGDEQRGGFSLKDRYGGGNNHRGREGFNGRQACPPRGGVRVEKWKHDLFEEANKSPTQKNEEDQIAKVEALLSS